MPINPSLTDEEEERYVLRPYRGKESDAIDQNILLKRGELFIEYLDEGIGKGIGRIKIGDGVTPYRTLPYFIDQTDISDSFLKKFIASTVTDDTDLLNMITNDVDLATITAVEKKLFENRIANEVDFGTSISSLVEQIGKNTSSISTLWSTAIDNTGNNDKGDGSNNGTTQSATANTSLRDDINSLWDATFNNESAGIGNQRLRTIADNLSSSVSDINTTVSNHSSSIGTLWSTVIASTSLNNQVLRDDITDLQEGGGAAGTAIAKLNSTVFENTGNNQPGNAQGSGMSTVAKLASTSLRQDINTLWLEVFQNQANGVGNKRLSANIQDLKTNFQAGVDSIYNAIVARGTTPASKSLSDVVAGIGQIETTHTTTYTPTERKSNCDMGVKHYNRYVNTNSVPNYNDSTYPATSRSNAIDMGATNTYRYVNTSGVPNNNYDTYTFPANDTGGTKDLGATNVVQKVNASNVYNKGVTDADARVNTSSASYVAGVAAGEQEIVDFHNFMTHIYCGENSSVDITIYNNTGHKLSVCAWRNMKGNNQTATVNGNNIPGASSQSGIEFPSGTNIRIYQESKQTSDGDDGEIIITIVGKYSNKTDTRQYPDYSTTGTITFT